MDKKIWFDMDGTIADLYGVENWLDKLEAEDSSPYAEAKPLLNLSLLARTLNKMIRNGWEINIVSWLSRSGSSLYKEEVTKAKLAWLKKHLKSVNFSKIDIISYGTPKEKGRNGFLFDDELKNRTRWGINAFDENNIILKLNVLNELI